MRRQTAAAVSVLGMVAALLPWFTVLEPLGLGSGTLFLAMLPLVVWGGGITGFKPWAIRVFPSVCIGIAAFGVLGAGLVVSERGPGVLPLAAGAVAVAAPVAGWWLWRR
ncbi:hypothetical protein C8P66_11976 [Humitalea rosea]|uniref:Uncharacterized protein n=1 Tax=Humitalea rosea TaxID=990373 RepID=A0A2W7I696_9PROT|nr:hypothetical protein [Humitalea rosea]PZW42184.1 hypothetical protein C8P66_11976 [Humitalea rosea]